MNHKLNFPVNIDTLKDLKSGDIVSISGEMYVARDAAHKRMIELVNQNKSIPFDVNNQIIYYVGPCPAREGQVIGSAGPTTSGRMDAYTPQLIELGLKGMIGKGMRSTEVKESMVKYGAVYFGAIGGAGALIAKSIISEEIIAFPELGPEALRKISVKDFPAVVIIDIYGNDLYESGKQKFKII